MAGSAGRLLVVATPIGNLADLSARAREALERADVIAAEDTRHTGALLHAAGIATAMISLHEHNEVQRTPALLARLAAGETVALVSDAGTPLISDPGFELVRRAVAAGIEVQRHSRALGDDDGTRGVGRCRPSASASRASCRRASASGAADSQPLHRRRARWCSSRHRTASPRHSGTSRASLALTRAAVLARELTKVHETIYRGTLAELAARAGSEENFTRGEITLVVHGAEPKSSADRRIIAAPECRAARRGAAAGAGCRDRRAAEWCHARRRPMRSRCARAGRSPGNPEAGDRPRRI